MSSLVQAKWVSSAIGVSPSAASLPRTRYSTAFTSWRVVASSRGELVDLGLPEVGDPLRAARGRASASSGSVPNMRCSVREISHSTSTCTRARLSPASERCSPSSSTAAR